MIFETIKELCSLRKIKWSTHAAVRIQERGIARLDVLNCLENGQVIEDYPEDFPHPSCLVFGYTLNNRVLHVVAGCDGEYVYIVTAYFPDLKIFKADLKTRKER